MIRMRIGMAWEWNGMGLVWKWERRYEWDRIDRVYIERIGIQYDPQNDTGRDGNGMIREWDRIGMGYEPQSTYFINVCICTDHTIHV